MSNPDDAAAQSSEEVSFADQVAKAVNETTVDKQGKDVLPEGLDEGVSFAANAELRRRHTQSQYSKSQQSLKARETENTELRKLVVPQLDLSVEEAEELEDLKSTDPDAWEKKLNEYRVKAQSTIDSNLSNITSEAEKSAEVERRAQVLEDFIDKNPGFVINDEVLANDIPPRIKNKLKEGAVTFEEFLVEAKDFFAQSKKIGDANDSNKEPDLNNVGGSANATDDAVSEDIRKSYETEIY